MHAFRTLVAAALLASLGAASGSTILVEAASPTQTFYWTPEIPSSGDTYTPMIIGSGGAVLMTAGWWQVPPFDSEQYVTRLWRDTDPAVDTWSLGELLYDSKVDPRYLSVFAPGDQLVFELINFTPEVSLRGAMGFVVPVPPAVWLFLTAVIGLIVGSRKKQDDELH
jgi:hypothetical protein